MRTVRRAGLFIFYFLVIVPAAFATTVSAIVPSSAARGAHVVIAGSALSNADVTFASHDGGRVPAVVTMRSATLLEVRVPPDAVSGELRVGSGSATPFAVTAPPPFVKSATLIASANAHQPFHDPSGLAVTVPAGDVYVADRKHAAVLRIQPSGVVSTAAVEGLREPAGVVFDRVRDVLYVVDAGAHVVHRVSATGAAAVLAGSGRSDDRDGQGSEAGFRQPGGIAIDGNGNVYVADTGNHKIRRITPAGAVTTIAGAGRPGYANGSAPQALFKFPQGIAVDGEGTVYVADTGNHAIRRLAGGVVATLAGVTQPGHADGPPHLAAFKEPRGLTLTDAGELLVADTGNHSIRSIADLVSTVAGTGKPGYADGDAMAALQYKQPAAVSAEGPVYILDAGNEALRVLYESVLVSDVYPRNAAPAGGEEIRITGTGFVPGRTAVTIGGTEVVPVYVSSTLMRAVVPPGFVGPAGIVVTTPAGTAELDGVFEYRPPYVALAISPAAPLVTVGQTLTLALQALAADGSTTDVTDAGSWTSSNSSIATVDAGMLRAIHPGAVTITASHAGLTATAMATVQSPYSAISITPSIASVQTDQTVALTAYGQARDGSLSNITALVAWSSANPAVATVSSAGIVEGLTQGTVSITASLHGTNATASVTVKPPGPQIPPDPATIAPPIDATIDTSVYDATRFLYTGPNAIQTGVTEAVDVRRVSAVRGRVLSHDGAPLPGVRVTLAGRPGAGQTLTREDGAFDFVLNGGGDVVFAFEKEGYLPVERSISAEWQDYDALDDVVMLQLDVQATRVELAAAAMQVAQGSTVVDSDGQRQSTLLVPAGTSASLIMPDGTQRLLPALTLRATEYTAGGTGPQAMPAVLPAQSGYTYCVELSADEAIAAGAESVRFSQPVVHYVENFLDFPVGGAVPAGYYDRRKHAWVASANGRVIRVVQISAGLAQLDINGDGAADDAAALAAIGVTGEEQQRLATLYPSGRSLWRVPIPHLTPWDLNWPYGPPSDAVGPSVDAFGTAPHLQDSQCQYGSVIECENLVLRESIPIVGTPFTLHYGSDRTPGRKGAYDLKLALTGTTVPASMRRIVVEVEVAGQKLTRELSPQANLEHTFTWDGRDRFGRTVQGPHSVDVNVRFVYPAVYQVPAALAAAFAQFSGVPFSRSTERLEVTMSQKLRNVVQLGSLDQKGLGLGGWSLSPHHVYMPSARAAAFGNGRQLNTVETRDEAVLRSSGDSRFPHGVPLKSAILNPVEAVAHAPDGTMYILHGAQVSRVDPQGMVWNFVNGSGVAGFSGDGGPAVNAQIRPGEGKLAVDRDGNVFIADQHNGRVRRIDRNGIITTYAGGGLTGSRAHGVPATLTYLHPTGIAAAPDGSLYVGDASYIRRIGPDGIITTVAGNGQAPFDGEQATGRAAMQTPIGWPKFLHADPGGGLLIVDFTRILRLTPDGRIVNVAGRYWSFGTGTSGDGGPANSANLTWPSSAIPMPDGSIVVGQDHFIRRISPGGIITRLAGSGGQGAASGSLLNASLPRSFVSLSPSGELIAGQGLSNGISQIGVIMGITEPLPGVSVSDVLLPDRNGSLLYRFDDTGRHLATLHADRLTPELEFEYGAGGLLTGIRDRHGNQVTIERSGSTVRIVAPRGRVTTLTLDGDGYVEKVRTPAGRETAFDYDPDGRLTSMTSPEGRVKTFQYDAAGLLATHRSAGGKQRTLERTTPKDESKVTVRTGLGRVWSYVRTRLTAGARHTVTAPDGTQATTIVSSDGATHTGTAADGTTMTVRDTADPRFGMAMPVFDTTLRLPSGLQSTATGARTYSRIGGADSPQISQRVDTMTVNGRAHRRIYTLAQRTVLWRTASGREIKVTLDDHARPALLEIAGIAPATLSYDAHGRVESISQGGRSTEVTYDASDNVASVTDFTGHDITYSRDADGVLQSVVSGSETTTFDYDGDGNLLSLAAGGRAAHAFTYTSGGAIRTYTPPGGGTYEYRYDQDQVLDSILLPDGTAIDVDYDGGGRPLAITTAAGTYGLQYAADGTITSVTAPGGVSTSFVDDGGLLREMTWSGPVSGRVAFGYNADHRVQTETVGGASVAFGYDPDGLLTAAGALTLRRDTRNGMLLGTTLGQLEDAWSYNSVAEPMTYTATIGGAAVYAATMTRRSDGMVSAETETIGGVTTTYEYTYDAEDRLKRVSSGGAALVEFDYDAAGNRTGYRAPGVSLGATYGDDDRLLTYGDETYTFTAAGHLRTKTVGGVTTTYDYDDLGNLRAVLTQGREIQYVIDGQNRRIGKKIDGALVQGFLYGDRLRIAAELDSASRVVSRFVYGSRTNVPEYLIRDGVTYRIVSDYRGSTRLVIDAATGAVAQRIDYDAFGNVLQDTNPGFQPFGFAGGLYDRDTGLVRFGARDYDPHTGRFTTKDPKGFAGGDTNLYVYVMNDPVNLVDPMGTDWVKAMEPVGDFFAGMGDTLSFGLTTRFNEWTGASAVVDECSGAFGLGELAGTGVSLAFGGSHLGRNAAKMGIRRLAYDNRAWNTVRRAWSGRPPTLQSTGRSLHHWLFPQRSGVPQGVMNAGFNYFPISAGFNSWMNGSTFTRTAVEWGVKGVVGGMYGGLLGGGSGSDGCECQ